MTDNKKVVIIGDGVAHAANLMHEATKQANVDGIIPEDVIKADIMKNTARNIRRRQETAKNNAYIAVHPNLKTSDVPGGHNARKMDHEQHEQAKLQAMGIDCRKTAPSVAERRRMRRGDK